MATQENLSKTKQQLLDIVLANLEKGQLPWDKPWISEAPINAVTEKQYRGINDALLFFVQLEKGYTDCRWATFNQITEKKWHLKKGSKGVPVEFYSRYDFKNKKKFNGKEYIDKITAGMTDTERDEWVKKNIGLISETSFVFNAANIEGIKPLQRPILSDAEKNARCESIISSCECSIVYDQLERAYYSIVNDKIHLPQMELFKSVQNRYATTLHEMAHATGHSSRLNRFEDRSGEADYAREELRAEIASMFIQQTVGIDMSSKALTSHSAYIQSWFEVIKDKPTELIVAFQDAGKIEKYILNREREFVTALEAEVEREVAATTAAAQELQIIGKETAQKSIETEPVKNSATSSGSKLYQDYLQLKEKHIDSIVMYRIGDFYEMFGADAKLVADKLELTLTTRSVSPTERIPMCGIPCRTFGAYSEKLAEQGYSVVKSDEPDRVYISEMSDDLELRRAEQRVALTQEVSELTAKLENQLRADGFESEAAIVTNTNKAQETITNEWNKDYSSLKDKQASAMAVHNDNPSSKYSEAERQAWRERQKQQEALANGKRLEDIVKNIPDEMRALPNWVVFKYVTQPEKDKNGNAVLDENGRTKYEKVKKMYDVNRGVQENGWMKFASPTDSTTWTTFENALEFAKVNNCAGLSIAMDGTGMSCIDVDKLNQKESAKIIAEKLLKLAGDSYAEKSVSGNGIHVFVKGTVGENYKKRSEDIECYHSGRFMSLTGNIIEGHSKTVNDMSPDLRETLRSRLGKAIEIKPYEQQGRQSQLSDEEVIAKVLASGTMAKDFDCLMNYGAVKGDTSSDDFNFCKMLACYTQDANQIERIFRQHRYRQSKGEKYVVRTVTRALGYAQTKTSGSGNQESVYMSNHRGDRERSR